MFVGSMDGKNRHATDQTGDLCFCDGRCLGGRDFCECACGGGAADVNSRARSRGYSFEYGE